MKLIQRRYRKWRMSKLLLFPHHCLDDTSYRLVLYIVCTYLLIDSCCAVRQGALSITFCMNLRRWQDANFQVKKFGTRQSVCCMNNSKQWCDLVVAELLCFFLAQGSTNPLMGHWVIKVVVFFGFIYCGSWLLRCFTQACNMLLGQVILKPGNMNLQWLIMLSFRNQIHNNL